MEPFLTQPQAYNFVTRQYEPFSRDNVRQYIQQRPEALGMFDTMIAMGKTPEQAMLETARAILGRVQQEATR